MTILFRNNAYVQDNMPSDLDILLINSDRQIIVNPLEDLEPDEKLAILTDIINSDPIQNELNITKNLFLIIKSSIIAKRKKL